VSLPAEMMLSILVKNAMVVLTVLLIVLAMTFSRQLLLVL
jgi:hypothetical protein